MRDISTRPPSDSPHHSAAASSHPKKALALTKLATGLVSGFESLIHGLSSIPVAGSYTPVIKTLPEAPVAHQPAPRVKGKKRAAVKAAVVKTAEATKESASKAKHKTKEHLKTPLGKTTVVQAALVLGLFAYVTNLQGKTHQLIQEKAGNQAAATTDVVRTYRQYLPASADASTVSKAYTPEVASTDLPLMAWITPWNITQQQDTLTSYKEASAFWGTLSEDGVSVKSKGDWSLWKKAYDDSSALQNMPRWLTISGDPERVLSTISNTEQRKKHIAALIALAKEHTFSGIDVDYEGLGATNKDTYTSFIGDLRNESKAAGLKLAVTVEARLGSTQPMDWPALANLTDQVRIMVYDYHSRDTDVPGPIAPIGWLKEVLDDAITKIPRQQIIVGLPNYGYDWTEPTDTASSWSGVGISYNNALALSNEYGTPIVRATGIDSRGYDIGSVPTLTYTKDGRRHTLFLEDSESLIAKQQLAKQYQVGGTIVWSVGKGDPLLWN